MSKLYKTGLSFNCHLMHLSEHGLYGSHEHYVLTPAAVAPWFLETALGKHAKKNSFSTPKRFELTFFFFPSHRHKGEIDEKKMLFWEHLYVKLIVTSYFIGIKYIFF